MKTNGTIYGSYKKLKYPKLYEMTTAFFSSIEKIILSNISKTKHTLQIAVAWFTNPKLSECILNLSNKNVYLEIILSDDDINFSNPKNNFQEFINEGIIVKITRFPSLMHHKFCIIDEKIIISGSYNWTLGAEKNNFENVILSTDINLVSLYVNEFNRLSQLAEKLVSITDTTFNSYMSKTEKSREVELLTTVSSLGDLIDDAEIGNEESLGEEFELLLDDAELLYLQGKHQDSINLCKESLKKYPNSSDMYELIASSKWRQGKFEEQVEYAQKAVDIDNLNYQAYNTLGNGYAKLKNESKSIEAYRICISANPENYVYYGNRGKSYRELGKDTNFSKQMRSQFMLKASSDLEKVIEITTKLERKENGYGLFYSRGIAFFYLNKLMFAKNDLKKALELYSDAAKNQQDIHEYREIKKLIEEIESMNK
ncbi:MAG: hypothetical protein DI598_11630 [Pseudopedobacter saltans]|uniref:phospholipase D n=1 Tax=Pseudopedobacter saltans TaxID=151895 RepID=A0A2W5EU53_9SPHI|nr:MAG: hypothetical protein DI598_11630 [Pseudopedobacter saltans]